MNYWLINWMTATRSVVSTRQLLSWLVSKPLLITVPIWARILQNTSEGTLGPKFMSSQWKRGLLFQMGTWCRYRILVVEYILRSCSGFSWLRNVFKFSSSWFQVWTLDVKPVPGCLHSADPCSVHDVSMLLPSPGSFIESAIHVRSLIHSVSRMFLTNFASFVFGGGRISAVARSHGPCRNSPGSCPACIPVGGRAGGQGPTKTVSGNIAEMTRWR
jgi:hypothetical protein